LEVDFALPQRLNLIHSNESAPLPEPYNKALRQLPTLEVVSLPILNLQHAMFAIVPPSRPLLIISIGWLLATCTSVPAQTQPQKPDVVRVYTELVQTDVMVFDKQGQFVNNLRKEDFELRIDGEKRPIDFFERITAGSANEESQLAAARGSNNSPKPGATAVPLDRGRTIFFYVDDIHLDLSGAVSTRKMITQFIEKEMGQNDEAAIASATGQIGFLQQLTNNRTVLKAAVERLKPNSTSVSDGQRPPMSEYQALLISRYDRDTTDYFVDALLREIPMLGREAAATMVMERAQQMLVQAANFTRITLSGLDGLVRSSMTLPGRKIVFFVSNGFFLDLRNGDSFERVQRLTSIAARSGVVIYSMDSRGLTTGLPDASTDVAFDTTGRLARASAGELVASQDAMNALARDTGGRPFFNSNSLDSGLKKALQETSTYYLLAWKPDAERQKSRFRKIDVRVVGKPDVQVRVRKGFFDVEPPPETAKKKAEAQPQSKIADTELRTAITSAYPSRAIPVILSLSYVNTPSKGELLSTSLKVPGEFLSFGVDGDKSKAVIELIGAIYDDRGRMGGKFNERLTITARPGTTANPSEDPPDVTFNFPIYLTPGLYQVRVGARDILSGKTGSAHAWTEIPNLSTGQLALSSLLVGERESKDTANASSNANGVLEQVNISVDRRFHRDAFMRFLVFVYNAAVAQDAKPDAAIQVQLVRDDQPVVTTALKKIVTEGVADMKRLPYAAEVPLAGLQPGRYILSVTVVDRVAKTSASQQRSFEIY
jgi:VWFA-related protein